MTTNEFDKIYRPGDKVLFSGEYEVVDAEAKPLNSPYQITIQGFSTFPEIQSPVGYGFRLVRAFRQ